MCLTQLGGNNRLKTLKKAFLWGTKRPDVVSVITQLRILCKELERERNRLEREVYGLKARAVSAIRDNNMDASRTYAVEIVRLRRQALSLDKTRLLLLRIASHLKRAQTTANATKAMERVLSILSMLREASAPSEAVKNYDEIARLADELEIESSITEGVFDSGVSSQVTPEEIAAVMSEIGTAAGSKEASSVAVTESPDSETADLEKMIKSLERELGM